VQIDWFTLLAQVVNFIILLYLLKRFLYGPIIETMDRREQKITARLEEAEEKRLEAEQQEEDYRRQLQELEERRDEELAAVRAAVESRRKQMLAEAEQEVERKKQDWQEALARQQEDFLKELRQQMGREAGEIARSALRDLADVQVETRMADLFLMRLQELNPEQRQRISDSIRKANGRVTIQSAFELPAGLQQTIRDGLREHILVEEGLDVHFKTEPALISGIEMRVHGHQVAWTIQSYLADVEARIRQAINEKIQEGQKNGAS